MKKVGHSCSTFLLFTGNIKFIVYYKRDIVNFYPKEELDNYLHKEKLLLQLIKTLKIQVKLVFCLF